MTIGFEDAGAKAYHQPEIWLTPGKLSRRVEYNATLSES
jgi:hypothetical protein